MNLIKISNQYHIDIDKYEKISFGDILPSRNELLRKVCHPTIESVGTTEKRLQDIIKRVIVYENAGGNKIRITSIEPVTQAKSIIESKLKAASAKASKAAKTYAPRQSYSINRNYLLDFIIFSNEEEIIYITSSEIIKSAGIFKGFYYDYCNIHYDKGYPTAEEIAKLQEFALTHWLTDKYLVEIMEELSNKAYEIFKKENIFSWAKRNGIQADRVLCKNGKELDDTESGVIHEQYIQPFINKGVPAKSIIRLANRKYIKDNNENPLYYRGFFYAYKFTKPENEKIYLKYTEENLIQHQKEINKKIIEYIRSKAIDSVGEDYHKTHKSNLIFKKESMI